MHQKIMNGGKCRKAMKMRYSSPRCQSQFKIVTMVGPGCIQQHNSNICMKLWGIMLTSTEGYSTVQIAGAYNTTSRLAPGSSMAASTRGYHNIPSLLRLLLWSFVCWILKDPNRLWTAGLFHFDSTTRLLLPPCCKFSQTLPLHLVL